MLPKAHLTGSDESMKNLNVCVCLFFVFFFFGGGMMKYSKIDCAISIVKLCE